VSGTIIDTRKGILVESRHGTSVLNGWVIATCAQQVRSVFAFLLDSMHSHFGVVHNLARWKSTPPDGARLR